MVSARKGLGVLVAGAAALLCACAAQAPLETREPTAREMTSMRYELAEALVEQRSYEAAAPVLRDLIARYPREARLHLLLGIVLREKGVLEGAEKELRTAIRLDPRAAAAHAALGVLLTKNERFDEAEREHRRACELAPQSARYRNDLGFFFLVRRRLDEAREALLEALRLDPTMRVAFNNLGFVYGLQERKEEALEAFRQAGSLAMALTNMGAVAQMRGDRREARRYYEQALRSQHDYPPALANLRALDPNRAIVDDAASAADGSREDDHEGYTDDDAPVEVGEPTSREDSPAGKAGAGGADAGVGAAPGSVHPRRASGEEDRSRAADLGPTDHRRDR